MDAMGHVTYLTFGWTSYARDGCLAHSGNRYTVDEMPNGPVQYGIRWAGKSSGIEGHHCTRKHLNLLSTDGKGQGMSVQPAIRMLVDSSAAAAWANTQFSCWRGCCAASSDNGAKTPNLIVLLSCKRKSKASTWAITNCPRCVQGLQPSYELPTQRCQGPEMADSRSIDVTDSTEQALSILLGPL